MPSYTQFEIKDGIARLTLNRPEKRNALRRDFIEELNAHVQNVANDESVRALLLMANGKVFCAGMDLGQMQERAQAEDGGAEWQKDSEVYADLLRNLFNLNIPTVAVVQGPALAGGFGIVLACDIVIATDTAFFMLPEPIRGITAAMVTPFLVHRVGSGPANYMLLSCERISATDANRFGLCHILTSPEQLDERLNQLVDSFLSASVEALAITKNHVMKCTAEHINNQLAESISVSAKARETDDAREGLAAFLEKRKPNWQPESE